MQKLKKHSFYFIVLIAMGVFVIVACSDDDTEPKFSLNLEVNPEEAGDVTGAGSYGEGEQVSIAATPGEGREFLNWTGDAEYLDDADSAEAIVTMPADDVDLTANFQDEDNIIYGDGVTDIDGNEYVTVIIGDQEWMAENLRVTRYGNEDDIPTGLSDDDWGDTTDGAYAIYNNDDDMLEAYGKLYNFYAVDDERGLCPEGWSVPSLDDWTQLVDYVVTQGYPNQYLDPDGAANALKSCLQVDSPEGDDCNTSDHPRWDSHGAHHGFDEFGFSALPGGFRGTTGSFIGLGECGYWWTTSEYSSTSISVRSIFFDSGKVEHRHSTEAWGWSVRCVRDAGAD